tara:strand:+ start:1320 stop:1565 length:246 start_codon:yes stop_codon:yes gene_type:complete
MKEYKITVQRTYNTTITLKFPDDGRDHIKNIGNSLLEGKDIWDTIYEKELEQMDVSNETWGIKEINTTITGALSNDTGPRN